MASITYFFLAILFPSLSTTKYRTYDLLFLAGILLIILSGLLPIVSAFLNSDPDLLKIIQDGVKQAFAPSLLLTLWGRLHYISAAVIRIIIAPTLFLFIVTAFNTLIVNLDLLEGEDTVKLIREILGNVAHISTNASDLTFNNFFIGLMQEPSHTISGLLGMLIITLYVHNKRIISNIEFAVYIVLILSWMVLGRGKIQFLYLIVFLGLFLSIFILRSIYLLASSKIILNNGQKTIHMLAISSSFIVTTVIFLNTDAIIEKISPYGSIILPFYQDPGSYGGGELAHTKQVIDSTIIENFVATKNLTWFLDPHTRPLALAYLDSKASGRLSTTKAGYMSVIEAPFGYPIGQQSNILNEKVIAPLFFLNEAFSDILRRRFYIYADNDHGLYTKRLESLLNKKDSWGDAELAEERALREVASFRSYGALFVFHYGYFAIGLLAYIFILLAIGAGSNGLFARKPLLVATACLSFCIIIGFTLPALIGHWIALTIFAEPDDPSPTRTYDLHDVLRSSSGELP